MCQPEFASWIDCASRNRAPIEKDGIPPLTYEQVQRFRKAVFERASRFMSIKLGEQIDSLPTLDENKFVVAAGHQPVIYHSGIARKNRLLSEVIRGGDAVGLNIIIDTDIGSGASLTYPQRSPLAPYGIAQKLLSRGGEIYADQRILPQDEVSQAFSEIKASCIPVVLPSIENLERYYLALADQPIVTAQTRIRRRFETNPNYFELPLTELIAIAEAAEFLSRIIARGSEFHRHFNSELDEFRRDHKIKNHANPFPNLESQGVLAELPFWVVDRISGSRGALYLNQESLELADSSGRSLGPQSQARELFDWSSPGRYRIAPRALLITALLRGLCSDYFIHGLGGARYDTFLDRLFNSWWKIPAPSFAVVTETRYLMPDLVHEIDHTEHILASAREIQFHLDRYLGTGTFPAEMERTLTGLWQERNVLKAELIELKRSGSLVAQTTQAMKGVDAQIKSTLQVFFSSYSLPSESTIAALRYREFPFMYFDTTSL